MKVGGIILCGGRSSRMGQPKAWLPFGAETLLQRVARLLRDVVDPVIVVAAPGQELPPLPVEIRIARDPVEHRGPLQGLAAGLAALNDRAEAAFVVSCDAPFLQGPFIQRMVKLLGAHDIAVPVLDGIPQPLAAVYRLAIRPTVEELLGTGRRRMFDLLPICRTLEVKAEEWHDVDAESRSLRNVNTPEDYATALRELGSTHSSSFRAEREETAEN